MIELYYLNCKYLDEDLINTLDQVSQERVLLKKEGIKRLESLGAKLLLKKYYDGSIKYENGKPIGDNKYVSISHSNGYALVGISNNPIGVDIEHVNKDRLIFSKLKGNSLKEKYDEWTKSEAYFKRTGEGFILNPTYKDYAINIDILNEYSIGLSLEKKEEYKIMEVVL